MTSPGQGRGPSPASQTGKAIAVVVVVVVVGILVLHHTHGGGTNGATATTAPRTTTTLTSPTTSPASTTTTTLVPVSSVKLQVLNGTSVSLLATKWTDKLRTTPGYNTLAPSDTTNTVSSSEIYVITPGFLPEANRLAVTVGLTSASINPTIPAPSSAPIPPYVRNAANLVLVIGPNLVTSA